MILNRLKMDMKVVHEKRFLRIAIYVVASLLLIMFIQLLLFNGALFSLQKRVESEADDDDGKMEPPEQQWRMAGPAGKESATTKFLLMQIPAHWGEDCGGLANQMWRFAVLFSMAQAVGRQPGILGSSRLLCERKNQPGEVEATFPRMHEYWRQNFNDLERKETAKEDHFLWICCEFVDPKIIFGKYRHTYLIVPPPPQSYKYFDRHFHEVRELFQFGTELRQRMEAKVEELFRDDPHSHKLCVHTRRGDFGRPEWPWHQPSTRAFTQAAADWVLADLMKHFPHLGTLFSLVLLGEDKPFLRSLRFRSNPHRVHIPPPLARAEDLALGVLGCHSLLITASSSTFAWWIGFLMAGEQSQQGQQPAARVYFNADFSHSLYSRHNFLPDWVPLSWSAWQGRIIRGH